MEHEYDIVIRHGKVVDGTGAEPFLADVAISGGRIAAVGEVKGRGKEELDAKGLLVTPGFVDIHTHYDGQATWAERLTPSSWHGITTVVSGNCGVGFAPVREKDHECLIELMEGIEDIPGTVLHDGLKWNWETFEEYMDALDVCKWDVDLAVQLPHAPLRVYVMGDRAIRHEDATPEDIAKMREITRDAMKAGAIGFSTSRLISHKSVKGVPTPSYHSKEEELTGIALGVKDAGKGVLQLISDFKEEGREQEYAMVHRIVEASGRPMSISVVQFHHEPDSWREHMAMIAKGREKGLNMHAQVAPRPVGAIFGLSTSAHPFMGLQCFREIASKTLEEKVAIMRTPEFRKRALEEASLGPQELRREGADQSGAAPGMVLAGSRTFPLGEKPDYGLDPETSVAAIAKREGRDENEVIYDLLLEDDGKNLIFSAILNYHSHDYSAIREMLTLPGAIIALGDGGAHVGQVVDATFQTTSLKTWGSDIGVPEIVRLQTSVPAKAVGLFDRGVIAPGMRADINLIDFDNLWVQRPYVAHDLPTGAPRLLQKATGYVATIVKGEVTYRNGEPTGALPGRLIRGEQHAPA
ncbi:amidohydrolase family protein [Novosphingobium sp. TH158]|uniref:N-acyl-D-amino-acid deacylase family protein n=1 Tax=Novosphingobium sp. TH158 TaxID=2067455 RepID=UPI000C7B9359|nr:amidohydrolase family protein [Novosphingobium sp. TH158]PLK26719.1 amidohydrolase [Novosphingobium sp. TH158]